MASGIIVIDKPAGWTSHDVVAKLRGLLRERRIGHAGTLDPMATGVLPVFVGRATRAVEFASEADKEYIAGVQLGVITDTQDTTGTLLERRPVMVGRGELEAALEEFRGDISQIPPMYSAVKVQGKKLYELARRGQEVERAPRPITIYGLELLGEDNAIQEDKGTVLTGQGDGSSVPQDTGTVPLSCCCEVPSPPSPHVYGLRVHCSKGTYVRTLCHDLGLRLGCGGALCSLRRTKAAGFTLADAVTLEQVAEAAAHGGAQALLLPVDRYFDQYPAWTADAAGEQKIRNGGDTPCTLPPGKYRVYNERGDFLMVGAVRQGRMTTVKSFFEV